MPTLLTDGWTGFAMLAVWLWMSFGLIARLWLIHRHATPWKKVAWSLALLVPVFGWIFYAGFFRIPERSDIPLEYESNPSTDPGSD